MKIAVINSSSFGNVFKEHDQRLREFGEVDYFSVDSQMRGKELADLLMGYEIIVSSVTPFFDEAFFEHKDKTRLISRHGIGYNNINIEAATKHGVVVTIVEALVEQEAVAEQAVTLLLGVIRQVRASSKAVLDSNWAIRHHFMGIEIKDKTVGVIGFGNIGSRVGSILHYGFGAKVLAYDPGKKELPDFVTKVDLETLLKQSDIISLNASLNNQSRHMIDEHAFSLMKQGVYMVNTARGELIDEDALIKALNSEKVAGIGMDVIEGEPINGQHRLLKYDQVMITPHTSAYTYECLRGMGEKVLDDVEKIINNETPRNAVNKDV